MDRKTTTTRKGFLQRAGILLTGIFAVGSARGQADKSSAGSAGQARTRANGGLPVQVTAARGTVARER